MTDSEREVLDKFWRVAMDSILLSEDSVQRVSISHQILQEKGVESLSFYATAYLQSGRKHLQTAFETVGRWEASEKKTQMERSLMVLTAQLQSPLLVELGLARLADADDVVRYWAVKAVASTAMAQQLTAATTGDPVLTEKVLKALVERVEPESNTEILRTMVTFAAMVNRPEARAILLSAAQKRIQAYMDWTVQNEQFDTVLLKLMGQGVLANRESAESAAVARRFAELLSLVFQRYMSEGTLKDEQRSALLVVIAEVDSQVLAKMLGVPQTPIVRAIQRRTGLAREYETIFGSDAQAGELATRLKFDYGKTADGKVKTAPPKLPAPPANLTSAAVK